jgi:urate oxidase
MSAFLSGQSYGKSNVRLTKVTRHADRHDLVELAIDVQLEGDFAASYLSGDNRKVVATDSMRNTVYALAADHPLVDPESFALALAEHFLARYPQVSAATIVAREMPWRRMETPAGPHPHSFVGGGDGVRTCRVRKTRGEVSIAAGLAGLPLLKTTDSAFRDFVRDEFTTLADADDRIFATLLDAEWTYARTTGIDWNATYARIVAAMLEVFAEHKSLAVQQTIYAMGERVLAVCQDVARIELAMPNQHRIPFNLAPLGRQNRNEIFVTTSEPYGLITATVSREGASWAS